MAKAKTKDIVAEVEKKSFEDIDSIISKEFEDMIDISKQDTKVKKWLSLGVYSLNYIMSKNLKKAIACGRITGIDGLSECLSGDTSLKIKRGKRVSGREYSLKEAYEKFNNKHKRNWDKKYKTFTYSLKENNIIEYNEINDIVYNGIKKFYIIKTESGKEIKATEEHPFKVLSHEKMDNEGFVEVRNLKVGDKVLCKKEKRTFNNNNIARTHKRKEVLGVKYHPYAWDKITGKYSYKRIYEYILMKEAFDNGLDYNEYLNILKTDKEKSSKIKYIGENVIHHKNGNHLDNRIENLEVITKEEHDKLHFNDNRIGEIYTEEDKIISISYCGEEEAFDLKMKDPFRNYIANDFIVHNCGKSLMAAVAMKDPSLDYIIILETEGGGNSDELITFAGADKEKVRVIKASTFRSYKINKKTQKIEEINDKDVPKNKDTDTYVFVEGIISKLKRFINMIEFNKIQKNILIVLDSLANIQSVRALSGTPDMGKRGQDYNAFFQTFDNAFERTNMAFIFTNKLYQSFDEYNPYTHSGGESPIYNSSVYLRLSNTSLSDDVSDSEMKDEKSRRKTALGNSLKTIKAKVVKSRFGTEGRTIPFLLDVSVGPVRLSGLFTLCSDFGVIKSPSNGWYEMEGIFEGKFRKKDFISMVMADEDNVINKIQEKLEEAEIRIKKEKEMIQFKDIDEEGNIVEMNHEEKESDDDENPFGEVDYDEMKKSMIRENE